MTIYRLDDLTPQLAPSAWVADSAQVIGSVTMDEHSSVWFGAILRADNEPIHIGCGSNIQEAAVIHVDPGHPVLVGADVTVGHHAMLHGCTIGDGSLIGIKAVILNGARIGKNCLVGAGALVTEGKEFPEGSLILGSPAKVVRQLTLQQIENLRESARRYVLNARRYQQGLTVVSGDPNAL
ncbi:MAG TPA: gamma carbonic anhydrase family protein [Eoetvoesiella sp.]